MQLNEQRTWPNNETKRKNWIIKEINQTNKRRTWWHWKIKLKKLRKWTEWRRNSTTEKIKLTKEHEKQRNLTDEELERTKEMKELKEHRTCTIEGIK